MAEAVERQPRQRLVGVGLVVGLLLVEELAAEPLGVDGGAVGAAEDPAIVVVYQRRAGVPTAYELERVLYRACTELKGLRTAPPLPSLLMSNRGQRPSPTS